MELSIVIVSFNTHKLTVACIKSVLADPLKKKEIIVVDNASEDESVKAIEKLTKKTKFVKLIKNIENLGFAKANNQGIAIAKGKYVLLLNSDTFIRKGSLKKFVDFAEATSDAGVVGARLLNTDRSVQKSCFNLPSIKRAITQYWLKKGTPLDKFAPEGTVPTVVEAVVGAAFLITPIAREKVGGLDERYFFFYEDLAYCRDVKKAGLKVYYLPTVEIVHHHGASGKRIRDSANQWRRLIPSSKIYHGPLKHFIFNAILWSGTKFDKLIGR